MFTGMGQMDRLQETQHLQPQPSQEWRQEHVKKLLKFTPVVNFTSKKKKAGRILTRINICQSAGATGRFSLRGASPCPWSFVHAPTTLDRLPHMRMWGDKDTTTIWWVQWGRKQSEWGAVRFRCREGLSHLGLTGLSSWVTKVQKGS